MSTPRLRFSRRQRLTGKRSFDRVFARRCRASDDALIVYADTNDLTYPRLGLAVPKRLGRAVARNRIKRRLREAFRTLQHDLPPGLDLVCIPHSGRTLPTRAYAESLLRLVPRTLKLLRTTRAPNVAAPERMNRRGRTDP